MRALSTGAIEPDDLVELGDVVAGLHPGRTDDQQVTVFNSVGIGLQDLAAAALARDRAGSLRLGAHAELRV